MSSRPDNKKHDTKAGILLFCMDGIFSKECLGYLLEYAVPISAIILPLRSGITGRKLLPIRNSPGQDDSILALAHEAGIPTFELEKINRHTMEPVFSTTNSNLIVVACFPLRIPSDIYMRMHDGAYNLHPSLLPEYRGPVPLFWQFYYGENNTGVTLHELAEGYDTGDIVYQEQLRYPDGISGEDANLMAARKSAGLVLRLLEDLETGIPDRKKQLPDSGSYFSWPTIENFSISSHWSAVRAYNFICATRHWNQPYTIQTDMGIYLITSALSYDMNEILDKDVLIRNQEIVFQFSKGTLVGLPFKFNA